MLRWSLCSKLKLKSAIMRSDEYNNYTHLSSLYVRFLSKAKITAKDYYAILGIAKGATQQDIKNAYYKLSKIYHPDKNMGCEDSARMFRIVTEAYEILVNYRTRRLYDKGIGGVTSKKWAHDKEVEPISEEDDAQTKFYKQHARRSERPHVSGRSTIYDFDEWARKTISESFQKKQKLKQEKELYDFLQNEGKKADSTEVILLIAAIILMGMVFCYVNSKSFFNSNNSKPPSNDTNKKS